eukprot:5005187-Karenia_brevis.AAC.1
MIPKTLEAANGTRLVKVSKPIGGGTKDLGEARMYTEPWEWAYQAPWNSYPSMKWHNYNKIDEA